MSLVESCCLCLEILVFLKQLAMVIPGSANHDCLTITIASSIVMFDNSLSESIALVYLRVTLVRYLAFTDRIHLDPSVLLLRLCLAVKR